MKGNSVETKKIAILNINIYVTKLSHHGKATWKTNDPFKNLTLIIHQT